jgi:hypothetical protein
MKSSEVHFVLKRVKFRRGLVDGCWSVVGRKTELVCRRETQSSCLLLPLSLWIE